MRTGALSDAAITAHCAKYLPIPLGKAQSILSRDLPPPRFQTRKLKYSHTLPRPRDFETMATSLARVTGNPALRSQLDEQYAKELETAPMPPVMVRPPAPTPTRRPVRITPQSTPAMPSRQKRASHPRLASEVDKSNILEHRSRSATEHADKSQRTSESLPDRYGFNPFESVKTFIDWEQRTMYVKVDGQFVPRPLPPDIQNTTE